MIKTNGLGNTFAFIKSKKETAYQKIYEQISEWLRNDNNSCKVLPDNEDLLQFIISQPSGIYRQITNETMTFLTWLKRLAEGMIEGEEDE